MHNYHITNTNVVRMSNQKNYGLMSTEAEQPYKMLKKQIAIFR